MTCSSGGVGTGAEELGAAADEEGADALGVVALSLPDGTGALVEPAKPCTASTMTSGGRWVS